MAEESFQEALDKDMASIRADFIAAMEEKGGKRRPRRVGYKPKYGTLAALRNWRLTVREAALRRVQVVLTYRKTTTGETKKYIVAPYSYRYRRLNKGLRKLLMAYDMDAKHIKGFVTESVKKAVLTERKFRPKWPVEIATIMLYLGTLFIV